MGKLALFGLCMKLIPMVYMVMGEIKKAKENDGKVDEVEGLAIFKKFADALKNGFMGDLGDE